MAKNASKVFCFGIKQFGTFHNSAIISKKPKDKPAIWDENAIKISCLKARNP